MSTFPEDTGSHVPNMNEEVEYRAGYKREQEIGAS